MTFKLLLAGVLVVVYTWLIYPLLLRLLSLTRPRTTNSSTAANLPSVSIIIAAHNEEQSIADKLQNCQAFAYPSDRLEIVVASDGSTDQTSEIVRQFSAQDSRITFLESDRRVGKSGIQNLAASRSRADLFLFTDVGTRMPPSVLGTMIQPLADSLVGLVTATVFFGQPKDKDEDAIEKGQDLYWRYELFLRNAQSSLGILATASGQALLVRRELFRPLPSFYGDDCILPLDVRLQGFKVLQDRDAIVFDTMPHSVEAELRTRIRMTARNWAGTLSRPAIFNPLRFPLTSLSLLSHKLLRWLTPFFLAIVFFCSALIALRGHALILFWLQLAFYLSALIGWTLVRTQRPAWMFGYSFSFCLANVGFMLGIVKAIRNQKIVAY